MQPSYVLLLPLLALLRQHSQKLSKKLKSCQKKVAVNQLNFIIFPYHPSYSKNVQLDI
jgi:hypothetical protein